MSSYPSKQAAGVRILGMPKTWCAAVGAVVLAALLARAYLASGRVAGSSVVLYTANKCGKGAQASAPRAEKAPPVIDSAEVGVAAYSALQPATATCKLLQLPHSTLHIREKGLEAAWPGA